MAKAGPAREAGLGIKPNKKRRYPVAKVKGGWTDEEDARLTRCGARWLPLGAAKRQGTCTRRFVYTRSDGFARAAPRRRSLVEKHGDRTWAVVASLLGGRIGKQVRARRSPAADPVPATRPGGPV